MAKSRRATRYMVLLAAFQALLARYTGQTDIAVGAPVAGRGRPADAALIGLFVNSVVLRTDVSGRPSFDALVDRVRATTLAALSHAETPFERVVDELAPERDLSRNPLYQVSFSMRNTVADPIELPGLDVELVRIPLRGSPFDLVLDLNPLPEGGLLARLQFATALFDKATAVRIAEAYQQFLRAAVADPGRAVHDVPLMSTEDNRVLVDEYNATAEPVPDGCLHELVAAQVARTPGAVALRWSGGELTYAELDARAGELAARLRAAGAGPETLVGVCLRRGPDLVVTLLGVLKAGAAYLPLDPAHPAARRVGLLDRAGVRLLVGEVPGWTGEVVDPGPGGGAAPVAGPAVTPDCVAYALFTSGSTGTPKCVAVTHRNLVNYVTWAARTYGTAGAGTALYSPVAFDMPVTAMFPALISGAPVTITDDTGTPGIDTFADLLAGGAGFDLLKLTPTQLGVLGAALPGDTLRTAAPRLVVGGELLTSDHVAPWREHAPGTLVFNEYGPTETTVGCATLVQRADGFPPGPVPLGVPIANTTMYVLDEDLNPVLPGTVGEMYVGGVQVARGYQGMPALTAERFLPDPFGPPGARFYRSGDLVRHRSDGEVEFIARADTQLKIRGHRVDPAEVEAALLTHPEVRSAVVVGHGADPALVAYLVPEAAAPEVAELRAHLLALLPENLVPSVFVALPEIPTTASGKVDRRALPDPAPNRLATPTMRTAPRTPAEHAIARIWADLLGHDEIGVHDDFFALGGNSLLATRVAFRLRDDLGADVPLAEVFAARTVEGLARAVTAHERQAPIPRVRHDRPLPLSDAQSRLWFLDKLAPGSTDYLVPIALRLRGRLDVAALAAALADLLARHAILRTSYVEIDGEPAQVVAPAAALPLRRLDASDADEALRLLRADLRHPFDLTTDLPVRATLITVAPEDHLFVLTLHHIASDGWSAEVLSTELADRYAAHHTGTPEPLAEPPLQYADFAAWQRSVADTPAARADLDHWRSTLDGLAPLELPTDRGRPRVRDADGDRLAVEVPAAIGAAVDELARRAGATPFMVLLAAFQAVLGRWCDQDDVAVGTAVAGRAHPDTEPLVGFFVNTLVLRTDLSGEPTFADLLDRVRDRALDAYAHAGTPFERIVAELAPERDPARNPLFQVMFEVREDAAAPELPGIDVERVPVSWPVAKFDLMLSVLRRPDASLRCGFEFATALFDRDTVDRFAGYFHRLLAAVLTAPDRPLRDVPLFTPAENRTLLAQARTPRPGACLPELVAEQAARTPDAVAVECGARRLTYAELDAAATGLARRLNELGVRPETPVAVSLRRDTDLVTAVLAVLRAGAVYVPIDPSHPELRRRFVLRDSGAAVLIGDPCDAEVPVVSPAPEDRDRAGAPLPETDPAQAAYMIYTSGSTGTPKGVVVSHEAIRNRVLWMIDEHGFDATDRVLQKTTVGFDASVWELLAPLVCGGTVVVAAEGVPGDPAAMAEAVRDNGITVLQTVPSVLRLLVEQPALHAATALRLVFCAGEPLTTELAARVPVRLVNTYGPTECAIDVTSWTRTGAEAGKLVPIGHPVDGVRIVVLDTHGRLVPTGAAGELCVAGIALARGYAGRGDLTAERFVPHPFPAVPGERLYRTGDRVRRRADGCLEYLGRLDGQVKVRGVRIEPGEVEAVLTAHPDVTAAAAGVHEGVLVAHVAGDPDPAALRVFLAERLPSAMVPSVLRVLPALPLTLNGKIDRVALAWSAAAGADGEFVAPDGPAQVVVAATFADVLGLDRVGAHDDFFALGGHSLLATRLVFRLGAALGAQLPVAEVFARRTVAAIADLVSGALPEDTPVRPVPRTGPLPPSSAQLRMWFLNRFDPGSAEYLVPVVLRLRGPLDVPALRAALDALLARHEVLRTRYVATDGVPEQVIEPRAALDLPVLDYTGRAAAAEAFVLAETGRGFVLDAELPIRAALLRVDADEHLFALTMHHIAVDGWSVDLLLRDLDAGYRRRAPAPLGVQYADFAVWQRYHGQSAADLAYWTDRLAGLTPLDLPTDRPHPQTRDARGDVVEFEVPAEVAAAVADIARTYAVTPFVVLLAAFQVLLARWSGQRDIAVGTPVAGRSRREVEDVVGLFVNTVVLRSTVDLDAGFAELLDAVRQHVVGAYSHQDLPFERLVDELRPERDLARNPLFQVMFELQHASADPLALGDLDVRRVPAPWRTAKLDLTLALGRRADGGLRGIVEYATAIYDRSTVERLVGHYLTVLGAATADPATPVGRLPVLTGEERARIVHEWNPPAPAETPACVTDLFARRVLAHPDAEAVAFGADSLTYRQLDERANRLAHHLRARGTGPGSVAAVCMERGTDVVVALLAVLKAGGMYVPLDPDHPADRLAFMLTDAGADVVVTSERFTDRFPGHDVVRADLDHPEYPATAPAAGIGPDDLAYMIFTSGSTGRPKGVLIEHGSYAHHCGVIAREYGIEAGDRVVLLSALTFDVAMDQTMATLLVGATIVVADPRFWPPADLPDRVAEHGITIMEITPAYYREVMHHVRPGDPRLLGLRLMNVGSDVVTVDDARAWHATGLPGRFLCNYGPTEATVTCVLHPVSGDLPGQRGEATMPIGRPVPGTRAYVLDPAGDPVPVGVPGELYLGGVRLARGYHRRPALSAEKFVPDPFGPPGARLYRTGDLVSYLADGTIEFLGRIDTQVKLRGFRIELGEIEAVLAQHPAIRAVAVVVREIIPGDRRLVAYLVPHGDPPAVAELREHVARRLPDYMVPALWTTLPELPLTPSKKVDRKALPAPAQDRPDPARPYVAPRDPAEEVVAQVWAELLGVDRIGVHDDVFELGAHSLLATRVLARLDGAFGVDLPLRVVFEATTVADLAAVVAEAVAAQIAELSDDEVAALLAEEEQMSRKDHS
ncbi:MAG TPA: amino acid adenylation domain-containing protein [Actinophytocola sp.]|nr:amino acid adenylation domain-containing protein [Actinophytocola sp.]